MIIWLDRRHKSWQANDEWLQKNKHDIMSEIKLQDRFLQNIAELDEHSAEIEEDHFRRSSSMFSESEADED